jgi:predicted ATPase
MGVVSCATLLPANLRHVMEGLALKSLLSSEQVNGLTRYRFFNTTRRYALEKLEHSGALRTFEGRYAAYIAQAHKPSGRQVRLQLAE